MRESIDLSSYSRLKKKQQKDILARQKYPNAEIYNLLGNLKATKVEGIMDNALGFLTDSPFGIPQFINSVKNIDKDFYLVNQEDRQYLLLIADDYIESHELIKKVNIETPKLTTKTKKECFDLGEIGEWEFTKGTLLK